MTSKTSHRPWRILHWAALVATLIALASCAAGLAYVVQYQALADDEADVVLAPSVADITYCTFDGTQLKLDIYLPSGQSVAPYSLLVYVHGGSFTGGDKRKGSGTVDVPAMAARGYAVAAVNYRLMPEHPFPAQVIDVKCAIRYLRAHAAQYQLKTDKIGIWGGSAGGNVAAMVGLTNDHADLESEEYADRSSSVQAVVEMFGPMDLTAPMGWLQRMLLRRAFGTDDTQAVELHQASPVNYITSGAPPFLLLHGEEDTAVPAQQAKLFYQDLDKSGATARLVLVKNANHNFKPTSGPISPSRQEISGLMGDFFDQFVAGTGDSAP